MKTEVHQGLDVASITRATTNSREDLVTPVFDDVINSRSFYMWYFLRTLDDLLPYLKCDI